MTNNRSASDTSGANTDTVGMPSALPAQDGHHALLEHLLITKLQTPRLRKRLVSRSHLMQRLQQGMEQPITLVSAPAGFGKTTLLAQWLTQSGRPTVWLSLEDEDNEPNRFLSYLITALQTFDKHLGTKALSLLRSPQPPPLEVVLVLLINDLSSRDGEELVLILDDYHVITAEPIHRALNSLVEHLPPQMHLIIATRADPPLPLTRLRARGQLLELRATDLRFSLEETSTFLHTIMGLDLPAQVLEALEQRTEGWIAGLQLAALSLHGRTDISTFLTAFTGSHRFVLDYLTDEVLARQPVEVQTFLLHTSILERLGGSLCDSVTGQEGGQAILEALEHANLFLVSLDDERHWYRYHHLFAQMLHSRLLQSQPELVIDLHRRASHWYEQHQLPSEAIQHALAAPDVELAARLIGQIGLLLTKDGRIYKMVAWVEMLPETLMHNSPSLCTYYSMMLRAINRLPEAQAVLDIAEACLKRDQEKIPADQFKALQGSITLSRAQIALFRGELITGIADAYRALDLLPETDLFSYPSAKLSIAHSYFVSGDMTVATQQLIEAAGAATYTAGNPLADLRSVTLLARLHMLRGHLREATATYKQALRTVPQTDVLQGLGVGSLFYFFSLGELHYERNELDDALHYLTQGMEMIGDTLTVEPYVGIVGYAILARLRQARGDASGAMSTLDAFVHLAKARRFAPQWSASMKAVRAQLELAQGQLAAAIDWADTSGLSTDDSDLSYPREPEYLTLARVRIAQGQHDPTAPCAVDTLHLLDRLLKNAEAKERTDSVLRIHILRVIALATQKNRKEVQATLKQVLFMAEPEGYIRLFVDEGEAMQTLLRQTQIQGNASSYIATLLSAFGEQKMVPSTRPASPDSLVESLTEREMEVLRLLAVGLSNAAIAQHLVITTGTVKRHVNSIYGKLGVGSRTQAVARSQVLGLL